MKPDKQPNPCLSVAIPTYNRKSELTQCLNSIVPQAQKLGIRIYISDNASSYDVEALVDGFRAMYPGLIYHRNKENLGLDGNVRQVISMAESEYVWVFCDDDVMADGALELLLPICRAGKYDFILPNRTYRDYDMSETIPKASITGVEEPTEFADPVDLLTRYCYSCYTFVGCLVVRLSTWREADTAEYRSYAWFEHLCVLARMMIGGKALVLPDCLIYVREYNATWQNQRWMVWGYHFPRALAALPDAYPNVSRRKVLDDVPRSAGSNPIRFLMTGRANGSITWKTVGAILEPYSTVNARLWWVTTWLVLFVPPPVMRLTKRLFGITKEIQE